MRRTAEAEEIIEPPNNLRAKVREIRSTNPADDPVARAEAAIEVLSRHFDEWVLTEIDAIVTARNAYAESGYRSPEARDSFYRAVHDLKGQATTLGFPLAARVAGSLCAILDHVPSPADLPVALVDGHVDAIRAIVREKARDEDDVVGGALAATLDDASAAYVRAHPRDDDEE